MSSLSISRGRAIGLGRCARQVNDIAPLKISAHDTSPHEVGMRTPTQALGLISAAASNASSARVE
jgi:hypothetical protein